jgi:hypothetical protein
MGGMPNLTTLSAMVVFTPAVAGCLPLLSLQHPRQVALGVWRSGFLTAAVAATLIIAARGAIPDFWSIVVGRRASAGFAARQTRRLRGGGRRSTELRSSVCFELLEFHCARKHAFCNASVTRAMLHELIRTRHPVAGGLLSPNNSGGFGRPFCFYVGQYIGR